MEESYPKYFQSARGGILGNFDHINGIGCKLASVVPRKLIKKIKCFLLSIGMGFDYSNNNIILLHTNKLEDIGEKSSLYIQVNL